MNYLQAKDCLILESYSNFLSIIILLFCLRAIVIKVQALLVRQQLKKNILKSQTIEKYKDL